MHAKAKSKIKLASGFTFFEFWVHISMALCEE